MRILSILLVFFSALSVHGQDIALVNPSFEGIPKQGRERFYLRGWYDCGVVFRGETPPDVHPINGLWGNFKKPNDGTTYVGLVTRDNDTYEGISQRLSSSMAADQCYRFSISIARNNIYISGSRKKQMERENNFFGHLEPLKTDVPYTTPVVLRIWGGNRYGEEAELLAESEAIDHNDWMEYQFEFKPTQNYEYFTLSAFYKVPTLETYNGHILIDNASDLKAIRCPRETDIYATKVVNVDANPKEIIASVEPKKTTPKRRPKVKPTKPIPSEEVVKPTTKKIPTVVKPKKPKINTDLATTIKKGQIIKLKNLFFAADASEINTKSFETLDELHHFMVVNPKVKIEVGGHTNGIPNHSFCDKLSKQRANAVTEYLVNKGISPERIKAVGYGKRKPIASNKTIVGRQRNQRVEIKILEL